MSQKTAKQGRYDMTILCIVIPLFFLLTAGYFRWGWDEFNRRLMGQTMAAWVQAVGSLGAIYAVVWNVQTDRRERTLKEELAANLASAEVLLAVAPLHAAINSAAYTLLGNHLALTKILDDVGRHARPSDIQINAIAAVSLEAGTHLTAATVLIRQVLEIGQMALPKNLYTASPNLTQIRPIAKLLRDAAAHLERAAELIEDYRVARGLILITPRTK